MKGHTWRIVTIVGVIVFSVYLLIPTILKFGFGTEVPRVVKEGDPWYYHVIPSETLKLGLDLRGGLHLVLGIDFEEVKRSSTEKLASQLKDIAHTEKVEGLTLETTQNNTVIIQYQSDDTWKTFEEAMAKFLGREVDFDSQGKNQVVLRLSETAWTQRRDQAIEQAVETLRNRIDEFGISEPIITRHGTDKILVQFPGVSETGRLKDIISRTAKLSFQIVRTGPGVQDGNTTEEELNGWVKAFEKESGRKPDARGNPEYLRALNAAIEKKLPKGTEALFHRTVNVNTREAEFEPYLVDRDPLVTGEDLQDAHVSWNQQDNNPEVNFTLTPTGSLKFEKATGENVGKLFAIVLDSNVHSAPRIREKIGGGHARIEMGGVVGKTADQVHSDAKDTALVLRSGALPARLIFLEERSIGPALGADAIRSGMRALLGGIVLIFVFIGIYYRSSGWFANFALSLNGLFTLATMAAFEGTLSLPGLAGITLGLGMSVDANVLIFEHMREELRKGRPLNAAIAEAYTQAFAAIFDANVTSVIAGVVLLEFGYGPIRGFAVTLVIGVISSMFTAVFVTRVLFDTLVLSRNRKQFGV